MTQGFAPMQHLNSNEFQVPPLKIPRQSSSDVDMGQSDTENPFEVPKHGKFKNYNNQTRRESNGGGSGSNNSSQSSTPSPPVTPGRYGHYCKVFWLP